MGPHEGEQRLVVYCAAAVHVQADKVRRGCSEDTSGDRDVAEGEVRII